MLQDQEAVTDLVRILRELDSWGFFYKQKNFKCSCSEDCFPILLLLIHFKVQFIINEHFWKDWNFDKNERIFMLQRPGTDIVITLHKDWVYLKFFFLTFRETI